MKPTNYRRQSMKLTKRDSLARMHVEVAMTSMCMFMVVLVHISVEKNLLLSNHLKANPVDPD